MDQELINKNVANPEEFWNCFLNNLQAPYAFWREFKNSTLQEWVDTVWNSPGIVLGINNLSQYPVLRGEALVVATDEGMLLTNYRVIYSEANVLINIPLHNMTYYDIQTDANDKGNDLIIKYTKSGENKTLRIDSWIKDEIVAAVRDAGEFKKLNNVQKEILELSHYELSKFGFNAPKIKMLDKTHHEQKGCF
ncbi:hypothetical protein OAD28_01270 [Flavobacteriales bacterium]|nr:hypothetical protein [Flavobacteriales bacterium]